MPLSSPFVAPTAPLISLRCSFPPFSRPLLPSDPPVAELPHPRAPPPSTSVASAAPLHFLCQSCHPTHLPLSPAAPLHFLCQSCHPTHLPLSLPPPHPRPPFPLTSAAPVPLSSPFAAPAAPLISLRCSFPPFSHQLLPPDSPVVELPYPRALAPSTSVTPDAPLHFLRHSRHHTPLPLSLPRPPQPLSTWLPPNWASIAGQPAIRPFRTRTGQWCWSK